MKTILCTLTVYFKKLTKKILTKSVCNTSKVSEIKLSYFIFLVTKRKIFTETLIVVVFTHFKFHSKLILAFKWNKTHHNNDVKEEATDFTLFKFFFFNYPTLFLPHPRRLLKRDNHCNRGWWKNDRKIVVSQ